LMQIFVKSLLTRKHLRPKFQENSIGTYHPQELWDRGSFDWNCYR
jgi:hypothetical protein